MIPRHTSRSGVSGDVDTAFLTTSAELLPTVPAAWRRQPSAAPSPILAWMLRGQATTLAAAAAAQATSHTSIHTASNSKATTKAPQDKATSEKGGAGAVGKDDLAAVLARRGVARKDPLLERLTKKKAKAAAQQQQQEEGTATTTAAAAASLADIPVNHWSRRKLSDMTSASWSVFREQLGIEVEAVNRKVAAAPTAEDKAKARLEEGNEEEGEGEVGDGGRTQRLYSVDMAAPLRCWEEAGLPYTLGRCVAAKYSLPTAVQSQCVPLALLQLPTVAAPAKKVDLVGVAETGSGKTMAYVVPLLEDMRLHRQPNFLDDEELRSGGPLGLILVPTRELAEQVAKEANALLGWPAGGCYDTRSTPASPDTAAHRASLLRWEQEEMAALPSEAARAQHRKAHNLLSEVAIVKLVGGESEEEQYSLLSKGAHIVVATVGQANALLENRMLALGNARCVVVDEADRMIAENQQDDLIRVLSRCPLPRQTLLFTATLSAACADIAKKFLSPDGFVQVRTPYRCASIRQNFEMIPLEKPTSANTKAHAQKQQQQQQQRKLSPLIQPEKFARLVAWLAYGTGPIVVFAGEKRTCDALQDELRQEKEHLLAMEEYASVESLVGVPPPGLLFIDDEDNSNSNSVVNASSHSHSSVQRQQQQQARHAATQRQSLEAAAATKARIQLENLSSIAVVHAELSQAERRRLVDLFRRSQRRVLLTTDLLARGLDVPGITLVVNYDLPWAAGGESAADAVVRYVHRIGRTGRAGRTGVTVSFVGLPAELVQKARQAVGNSSNSSGSGGSGGAAAASVGVVGKVYAPGTSEVVKRRDKEWTELTGGASASGGGGNGLGLDESDVNRADDYASDGENEEEGGGDLRARQRRRLEKAVNNNDKNDETITSQPAKAFASDEPVLKPLWEFLRKCVLANRHGLTTAEEAEALLRRQWYGKIDMEPALAAIMAERAAQGSRFGVIRH